MNPFIQTIDINKTNFHWILISTYCILIVMSNWFDIRLIQIGAIITDAGTLLFPVTYLVSDIINEVYGYRWALKAILSGFIFNSLFLIFGQIITHMPSPDFALQNNQAFDHLFTLNIRVILASMISYWIAEPFNVWLLSKLKNYFDGKYMAYRFFICSVLASALDTLIFSYIAFSMTMSRSSLIQFTMTMWILKIIIESLGLLIATRFAKRLIELS